LGLGSSDSDGEAAFEARGSSERSIWEPRAGRAVEKELSLLVEDFDCLTGEELKKSGIEGLGPILIFNLWYIGCEAVLE